MVMLELVVAIGILTAVALPVAFSFVLEQRTVRAQYCHAIAMEIVDGEMEILLAGPWQNLAPGRHPYVTRAGAATNLPPGQFTVDFDGQTLQLEWHPDQPGRGGPVTRVARVTKHPTSL
jgi:hypothetical protein